MSLCAREIVCVCLCSFGMERKRVREKRRKGGRERETERKRYAETERYNLLCDHSFFSVMNQFIQKLDSRYEKARKPGTGSTVKRERVNGLPSTSNPPPSLPSWMIDPSYKMQATTTVCISLPPMEGQDPPTGTVVTCCSCVSDDPYHIHHKLFYKSVMYFTGVLNTNVKKILK